jgi:hypothetical protein
MNFAKRLLMVSGALVLVGILGVLISPKAAHAVFTAVQVVNDAAHPVLNRNVDNAANEPFEWEAFASPSANDPQVAASFTVPFATNDGKNVQRLVIEHLCALCEVLKIAPGGLRLSANSCFSQSGACTPPVPGGGLEFFFPFSTTAPVNGKQFLSQPARIYVDPGMYVFINLLEFQPLPPQGICSFSASGHFVVN